ncbi:hypothetical protein DRQ50_14190, partial [bacterium]
VDVIPEGTNGCGTTYTSDQRNEPRPTGGLCDTGAYESPYIMWTGDTFDGGYTSTPGNWQGGVLPAPNNIPVFADHDRAFTVNANLTVAGWIIDSAYTEAGGINYGARLTVNGDWQQAGGQYGGYSGIIGISGDFKLSGASFASPFGVGFMTVGGGFFHTGGSFDPRSSQGGQVTLGYIGSQSGGPSFSHLTLNDGLLGYWKLDEDSGATASDSSGYHHDGALNGDPSWQAGTPPAVSFFDPGALHLERSPADYVSIPDTPAIDDLQEFTLSAWVWLDSTPSSTNMRIITLRNEKAVLRYKHEGTGKLQFYVNFGSLTNLEASVAWVDSNWYHVAATYDGSTMRLYLNGVELGTPVSVSGTVTPGDGVHLGWSGSDGGLDGALDDVRVYNRALDGTGIAALHAGSHPQTSTAVTTLTAPLNVEGDLVLNSGTLHVSASDHGVDVGGDLGYNGGVFSANNGVVTFSGAGSQTVAAEGLAFANLTIESGATLVDMDPDGLTVNNFLTNNGALQRTQDVNGSSEVVFFNTGDYGGLTLNANNADLGSTTVTISGNQHCTAIPGESVQRCFDIAPTNTTGRDAFVSFFYSAGELSGNTCSGLNAHHWNGTSWDQLSLDPSYGSGDIGDAVDLPTGASVTYVANATVDPSATGDLVNTATVAEPSGVIDPNAANDSASDSDTLTPEADLAISKDDGVLIAEPGDTVTYTITAVNNGPSDALSAKVEDIFPIELINCEWSCTASAGAGCTPGPVVGNLSDFADLPVSAWVSYTAVCTVDPIAVYDRISNTATVAAPAGVTDPSTGNNSATDIDCLAVLFVDGFESGDTSEWSTNVP